MNWKFWRNKTTSGLSKLTTSNENAFYTQTPMHITVHHAIGGKIIKFNQSDYNRDENDESLYVIHNDDDLGESIAKLITAELLKRKTE